MDDEHAFRPARRAGGVDDAGEIGRGNRARGRHRPRPPSSDPAKSTSRVRTVALACGHAPAQPLLGQHKPYRAVVEHVGEALGRIGRIERQIGAAGLQHGRAKPDDRVERGVRRTARPTARSSARAAAAPGRGRRRGGRAPGRSGSRRGTRPATLSGVRRACASNIACTEPKPGCAGSTSPRASSSRRVSSRTSRVPIVRAGSEPIRSSNAM